MVRYGSDMWSPDVDLAEKWPELQDQYDTVSERALFGPAELEPIYGRKRKTRPKRNTPRKSRKRRLAGDRR